MHTTHHICRSETAGEKNVKNEGIRCRRWPQNSKAAAAFSPELWCDAPPCNLPSVGARRAVRPAFLCLPTATHESFGHSCSRWGEMSPRWQSVLCVCVRLCFSPHKRVLLLYEWPESHPRGNVGKTIAGWRGRVGVAYCMWMHVCCPRSSWCALHAQELWLFLLWTLCTNLQRTPNSSKNFTTLESTNRLRCSAYVLRHARSIRLEGYWLLSCKKPPACY